MKNVRFLFATLSFVLLTVVVCAQNTSDQRVSKKMLADFEQMKHDLKLTESQKQAALNIWLERASSLETKMKNAVNEEDQKQVRLQVGREYRTRLNETFGKDLADKMVEWRRNLQNNSNQ